MSIDERCLGVRGENEHSAGGGAAAANGLEQATLLAAGVIRDTGRE